MPEGINQRVFTVEQVANLLLVNEQTVRRAIKSGRLKAIKFGGKAGYRIMQRDLEEFIGGPLALDKRPAA